MSNIIELAKQCQERHKKWIASQKEVGYVETLFFAITEDNSITLYSTPEELYDAKQCILIHERLAKAVVNSYYWYKFEFIDANGCIHDSSFGDDFNIWMGCLGSYGNQIMNFKFKDTTLYWCKRPWENQVPKIWDLYCRLKKTNTVKERSLTVTLFGKEEEILQLKNQIKKLESSESESLQKVDEYERILKNMDDLIGPIRDSINPPF